MQKPSLLDGIEWYYKVIDCLVWLYIEGFADVRGTAFF